MMQSEVRARALDFLFLLIVSPLILLPTGCGRGDARVDLVRRDAGYLDPQDARTPGDADSILDIGGGAPDVAAGDGGRDAGVPPTNALDVTGPWYPDTCLGPCFDVESADAGPGESSPDAARDAGPGLRDGGNSPPDSHDAPDSTTSPGPAPHTAFLGQSSTRAMWLWADAETAEAFLDNRWTMTDTLLEFAAAPHGQPARALTRIFFEARTYSRADGDLYDRLRPITYDPLLDPGAQAKLRGFNRRAHAQGITIEYLDGQAIWLASDENAEWPKQVCRDVVAFNQSAPAAADRLGGIHFDIEPHTVQSGPWGGHWWDNKLPGGYNADWTRRWTEIMDSCRRTLDAYELESGYHMTLSVDLGADYAYYNKPILAFFDGVSSPVDYVTLMNYYDNRANQNGQPSFFYGWHDGEATTGGVVQNTALWTRTPLLFGVETGPTSIAGDSMSFFQEGYTYMYTVIDQLIDEYSRPGMLGVAIHPWGAYVPMLP